MPIPLPSVGGSIALVVPTARSPSSTYVGVNRTCSFPKLRSLRLSSVMLCREVSQKVNGLVSAWTL